MVGIAEAKLVTHRPMQTAMTDGTAELILQRSEHDVAHRFTDAAILAASIGCSRL